MAPQVQCCISNPVVKEQRGSGSINQCISLRLQSLLSVWAAFVPPHSPQLEGGDQERRIRHWRELQVPNRAFVNHQPPSLQQPTCPLARRKRREESLMSPEPGSEVGGQRRGGEFHICFFKLRQQETIQCKRVQLCFLCEVQVCQWG